MPDKYIVEKTDLTSVANAIRAKNKTSDYLMFPNGFVSAIQASGGADLNFEVVGGTTQPSNPKENTIWVNTGTEITGWVFSVDEPGEPAEGLVWMRTGTNGTRFNALLDNEIEVRFGSAQQYANDTWTDVDAVIYQSGEWVSISAVLFYKGDKCESVTGGWGLFSSYSYAGNSFSGQYGLTANNTLRIGMPKNTANAWQVLEYATKDRVDVTGFKVLSFRLVAQKIADDNLYANQVCVFGLFSQASDNFPLMVASVNVYGKSPGYYEVPIEEVTGSYYIGGRVGACNKTGGLPSYYDVDEIILR